VYPLDTTELIVMGTSQTGLYADTCSIWWSTDAGDTWDRPEIDPSIEYYYAPEYTKLLSIAVNPQNPDEMVAIVDASQLTMPDGIKSEMWYTLDRGSSWSKGITDTAKAYDLWTHEFNQVTAGITSEGKTRWYYRENKIVDRGLYYTEDLSSGKWEYAPMPDSIGTYEIQGTSSLLEVSPMCADTFYARISVRSEVFGEWGGRFSRIIFHDGDVNIVSNKKQNLNLHYYYNKGKIIFSIADVNDSRKELTIFNVRGELAYKATIASAQTKLVWECIDLCANPVSNGQLCKIKGGDCEVIYLKTYLSLTSF
jgi:hypothetical protein